MAIDSRGAGWLRAARVASALALFAVGTDHLYEYRVDYYSAIPTIGTLFLLNAVGAFCLAAALLTPIDRHVGRRSGTRLTVALSVAGIALAAASLGALFISGSEPLFGFMESGYRTSIAIAIGSEVTAMVSLLLVIVFTYPLGRSSRDSGAFLGRSHRTAP